MRAVVFGVCVALSMTASTLAAASDGMVAHYSFDEGAGGKALDRSGSGNDAEIHGDAEWVTGPFGTALALDGEGDYVDCGTARSLNIAAHGTIMIWCCPKTLQGGLVNWSTGGGWTDERLVLAFNTYRGGHELIGCFADGKGHRPFSGFGALDPDQWYHFAVAFNGRTIRLYRDGLLNASLNQPVTPAIRDVPMWVGRCLGLGKECFHGLVDEVRVYNRMLSSDEILSTYRPEAEVRGKDTSLFTRPGIEAQPLPMPGKLFARIDTRAMRPLPGEARLHVSVCQPGARQPLREAELQARSDTGAAEVIVDLQGLRPGQYVLRVGVSAADGKALGQESAEVFSWPGQTEEFRNVKVLNNLAWELLNVRSNPVTGLRKEYSFTCPRDRWVYVQTVAEVAQGGKAWVSLASDARDDAVIVHDRAGETTLEAMRRLKAGEHRVHIGRQGQARLTSLVVRAVPALQHAFYRAHPHVHPYGPYDWEFLQREVLPNVNVMISGGGDEPAHLREWTDSGRSWIGIIGLPKDLSADDAGVDKAYRHWSGALGLQHPLMDGIIIDEFGGGDDPVYDLYRRAVERIYATPTFAGKGFLPYGGTFYGQDRSREFARTAVDGGGFICWERYLPEQPTEEEAWAHIKQRVTDEMPRWEAGLPGCTERMIVVYGYMSQPTESLNVDPSVDFKVYMDMQIRTLATHPLFFGLGGIQEYHSAYADEESVRWAARLYRHYCIEGKTQPLTRDPYKLTHLSNPDFADATDDWTIRPAERDSVRPPSYSGYSWMEGRYPKTTMGETFLLMTRSAKRPNQFSQRLAGLTPGRLYSMKLVTGDYQDLLQERSNKARHAISIQLDNVDLLAGPKMSFQFTFPNCYAHRLGKFDRQHQYWMNYHWRVFRANSETGQLTVSDWLSDDKPGGPIGQELMFNFIEVQPYIGE